MHPWKRTEMIAWTGSVHCHRTWSAACNECIDVSILARSSRNGICFSAYCATCSSLGNGPCIHPFPLTGYEPECDKPLLSIGALIESGHHVTFTASFPGIKTSNTSIPFVWLRGLWWLPVRDSPPPSGSVWHKCFWRSQVDTFDCIIVVASQNGEC